MHSSFASLRTPIDLSLCLDPRGSLPLLLQSAIHSVYFLSSRGFSSLPLACSWSPSCVRCPSRFPICYFPRGASLHSLLLSSFLQFLMGLLSIWWPFSSSPLSLVLLFIRIFFTCWVPYLSLWLVPGSFLCLLGFPCVLRMLLFLASHGYVPTFFWFPSFVTRLNLSSFATGSSLRAEPPLSGVHAFFIRGSLLVCFSSYPFSYVPISLLPSSCCVGSPLLRQVFLEVSLPPFFAGWHSRLRLLCFYFLVSAALSPSGFSLLLSSPVGGFL